MNRKRIILSLKIVMSGGLIWILFGSVDLNAVKEQIVTVNLVTFGGAIAVFFVQTAVIAWRWQTVINTVKSVLPFPNTLAITYMGLFFNQVLPSSVGGDVIRIYKASKSGMAFGRAVNTVLLDRVVTVLGLILLIVCSMPFFNYRVGYAEAQLLVPIVSLLVLGAVGGLLALMLLDNLPSRFSAYRVIKSLSVLAADTRLVFLSLRSAGRVMAVSAIGHANVTFGAFLIASSLGLDISWVDCMVLLPPVILVMALPISVAGWGVREGAMVTAFGLIGVPAGDTLVLSVLFGLASIVVALPGGLIWLLSDDGRKVDNIKADV